MQYHFVVLYDEETDRFEIDVDTTRTKFDSEGIAFDPHTQVWHWADELMEADYADYEEMLAERLNGSQPTAERGADALKMNICQPLRHYKIPTQIPLTDSQKSDRLFL